MLKKTSVILGVAVISLVSLFWLADRSLSDLFGYFRAGAETTIQQLETEVPDVVHDQKTASEIQSARLQLVDRQTQLNLSQNQLKDLEDEIGSLTAAIERRQQVLASAYPVLSKALEADEQPQEVKFINSSFSLDEFQREVDQLLALQQRDENTLKIKQQGFERLAKSVADGEAAVTEMQNQLASIEQEFDILKARREQASLESDTLDLIASATTDQSSTTSTINQGVKRLESEVERLEAKNKARRSVDSVNSKTESKLARSFDRLDALKKYADQADASKTAQSDDKNTDAAAKTDAHSAAIGPADEDDTATANKTETLKSNISTDRVVINIQGQTKKSGRKSTK